MTFGKNHIEILHAKLVGTPQEATVIIKNKFQDYIILENTWGGDGTDYYIHLSLDTTYRDRDNDTKR